MTYDKSYIPLSQGSGFFINKNTLVQDNPQYNWNLSIKIATIAKNPIWEISSMM